MNKKVIILSLITILLIIGITITLYKSEKETYATGTTLAEIVKNKGDINGAIWSSGASGVYATNYNNETGMYHDYRYIGGEVNNYVKFNNDLYRIIGVFDDYTHGVDGKYLVKLIRSRLLGGYTFGIYNDTDNVTYKGYTHDWRTTDTTKSNLNILLNEYFYNKIIVSEKYGKCENWTFVNFENRQYDCSNIIGYGIDEKLRNYIQDDVKWKLYAYDQSFKNFTFLDITSPEMYLCERGKLEECTKGPGGITENVFEVAPIGLLYASDYGYASGYASSNNSAFYIDENRNLAINNWLYKGAESTLSLTLGDANFEGVEYGNISISEYGMIFRSVVYFPEGMRPSFYLKSSVYVTGGDGSFDNPYTLSCDDCDETL